MSQEYEWTGLSEHSLRELRYRLCRLQTRPWLCREAGGRDSSASRIGRLLHEMIYSTEAKGKLTQKKLASFLDGREGTKVSTSGISAFRRGIPTKSQPWVRIGRIAIWYLLTGYPTSARQSGFEVAESIQKYFFSHPPTDRPPYFEPIRATSANAWSDSELAGEILWLLQDSIRNPGRCELVCVTGRENFFRSDRESDLRQSLLECARSTELKVTFVYPEDGELGRSSWEALARRSKDAPRTSFLAASNHDPSSRQAGFLTPHFSFFFLKASEESCLWILRNSNSATSTEDHMPVALRGSAEEVDSFGKWLAQLLDPTEDAENASMWEQDDDYVLVRMPEHLRSSFHDLLRGFEDYAAIRGYRVRIAIDNTHADFLRFKIAFDGASVPRDLAKEDRVRNDLREYIDRVRRGDSLSDIPIVLPRPEHEELLLALRNRILLLEIQCKAHQNVVAFYEQAIEKAPFGVLAPPSTNVQVSGVTIVNDQRSENVNIHAEHSNVSYKSQLDNVKITLHSPPEGSELEDSSVVTALEEIRQTLAEATTQSDANVIVAQRLEELTNQLSRPREEQKPSLLSVSANGLLEAAKAVHDLIPTLLKPAQFLFERFGSGRS